MLLRVIHLAAIALAWAGFLYRLRDLRRTPANRPLRALCLLLLSFAAAITIGLPPLYQSIPWLMRNPSSVRLVQHTMVVLGGFAARVMTTELTDPGERARTTFRFWAAYTVATLVAMAVLFHLAPVGDDADDFVGHYAAAPYVTEYLLVFLVYVAVSLAEVFRNTAAHARHTPRRYLRIGLRLLGFACLTGMVFALHKAGYALARRLDLTPPWPEGPVTTTIVCMAGLLFIVGATIASWAPRIIAWRLRLSRHRAYRRLFPLWSAIHEAMPNIALLPADRTPRGTWQTVEFRLYRRIIEIRDGILALRPYTDPGIGTAAKESAASLPRADQDARAEAAMLAAALRARAEDHRPDTDPDPSGARTNSDLDSEAAWLARVSDAFRRI